MNGGTPMIKTRLAVLALLALAALPARAAVVLIDSYDNALPPDGVYSLVYPNHFQAGDFMGPDGKKAADADFKLDLVILRAVAYKHVGKLPLTFQVIVPLGRVEEGKFLDATSSGVGDVVFGPGVFLYANEASGTTVSYWLYAYAPTGAFDAAKPLNLGGHHWYFEHQLAFNQTLFARKVVLDVNVNFYHHTEEPDLELRAPPRFELAAIAGYQLTPKLIAGVNGGAYWDLADAKVSGATAADTAARKTALGPMLSYQVTDRLGATLRWTHDLSAANDFKGDDVMLRAAYAF